MKKYMTPLLIVIGILVIGEGISYANGEAATEILGDTGKTEGKDPQLEQEEILNEKIPMIMVKGKLYYNTGRESNVTGRCGVMDGEITTTIDEDQTPMENDQSNFGIGYRYQYGMDDTIEIFMNDKWYVFEYCIEKDSLISYENIWYNKENLSQETIDWLDWYNKLTEEEQSTINYVPSELTASFDKNVETMEANN